MKIILFDIDGTLLTTGGAGRRAMEATLRAHFGSVGAPAYRYDGKTDGQIVRDLMRGDGHEDAAIDAKLPAVLAEYLERLHAELEANPAATTRYEGVVELLDALEARADRVLGLLTGNVERGAHRKLAEVGLAPSRFRVGAFGSDHEARPALPAVALARACALLGVPLTGDRLVIVGDTPFDLQCGREVGARAIGVATGHYSVAQLSGHDPHAVFEDLRDTAAVLAAIDRA